MLLARILLTNLTIYWATQTITPLMRDYYDNRWLGITLGPKDVVEVPTGIAAFANHFVDDGEPPREWAERPPLDRDAARRPFCPCRRTRAPRTRYRNLPRCALNLNPLNPNSFTSVFHPR